MLHVLLEETPTALEGFLGESTSLLSWLLTSMGSIINTIMEYPILFIGFIILVVSFAFGLVFRTAGQR